MKKTHPSTSRRYSSRWLSVSACIASLLAVISFAQTARAVSPDIVIAEVYGGGGNTGAPYKNDFVVLFNRGGVAVSVAGWSVQYASSGGSTWAKTDLTGTIPAGGYYLVQEAGGAVGAALPTPDASGTLSMSSTAGKIVLVNNGTLLTGACPTGGAIVDFVGFGTAATCFEGTGPTATISNTTSAQRAGGTGTSGTGCTDTDNNASDFVVATPNPRNSASPASVCGAGAPPSITAQPQGVTGFVGGTATFTVTASGTAPLTYSWYKGAALVTNDTRISGATSSSLTITPLTVADAGDYTVTITNSIGATNSSPAATLTVTDSAPTFVTQPQNRFNLLGTTARFSAVAQGTVPLTYRWQKDGLNLSDDARISGSFSNVLTISSVVLADAGSYTLSATNSAGPGTSSGATLTVGTSGVLVGWDFNGSFNTNNPAPSNGSINGTAGLVGSATGFSNPVGSGIDPFDPNKTTNTSWGSASYPAASASNKLAGVQFNISTVGFKNLAVSFDQRITATGSRYTRLQYTTNAIDYIDFPTSFDINPNNITNSNFHSMSANLAGFAGARNNANFGVRVVTEFESTAKYGASTNASYKANSSSYSSAGTISYDLFTITADVISGANNPPTIGAITNYTTFDVTPISVPVTIGDIENVAAVTVSATSSNQALLNDGQIAVSGSGSSRTLTITPTFGSSGVVPILVTATDSDGDVATTWFYLTIVQQNIAPTISAITHTNTLVGTPITIPFTISDDHSAAASMTLSESSLNSALLPDANVIFTGTGSNRFVTLTPVTNQLGVAPITITLNDNDPTNAKSTSISFTLMVRPDTNTVLNDFFAYADGSITAQSFGLWQNHSGTAGQMQVASGEVVVTGAGTEDVNIPLIGAPYTTNSSTVLYSSFNVRFTGLPNDGGSYFAHFKDTNAGAATGFGARVWASTLNAVTNSFRLGIANGANATNTSGQFPVDLQLGTNYTVVTKFVPATGASTIWINPTSELDTNVTATDVGPATRTNAIDVVAYALRQSGAEGIKTVDNLKVGLSFTAVTGIASASPIPLTVQKSGTNTVLTWSDSSFALQAAPLVTGVYTNVAGATSPYTNGIGSAQQYFRLKK